MCPVFGVGAAMHF